MKLPAFYVGCGCVSSVVAMWLVNPAMASAADAPASNLPAVTDFLQSAAPPAPGDASSAAPTLQSVILTRARELAAQKNSLAPKDAATKWIALAILIPDLLRDDNGGGMGIQKTVDAVSDALPPPAAWPELAAALSAATPTADPQKKVWRDRIQILIGVLNRDRPTLDSTAAMLAKATPTPSGGPPLDYRYADAGVGREAQELGTRLQEYLLETSDDLPTYREQIKKILADWATQPSGEYDAFENRVPTSLDLVTLLGKDEADRLLTPLIVSGKLTAEHNRATLALANEIAVREISRLAHPVWGLAAWDGGEPLYDALVQRFGYAEVNNHTRYAYDIEGAVLAKLKALVGTGKIDEAFALAETIRAKIPDFDPAWNKTGADALGSPGLVKQMADHLLALARSSPASAWWIQGLPFAEAAGDGEKWLAELAQARQTATGPATGPLTRVYRSALFDLGHEDEALAVWRQSVAEAAAKVVPTIADQSDSDQFFDDAASLVMAARLLQKSDLEIEALGYAANLTGNSAYAKRTLAGLYEQTGRHAEAASQLAAAQRASLTEAVRRNTERHQDPLAVGDFDTYLPEMADLYAKAGRWADVRALFEQGQWWSEDDLQGNLLDRTYDAPLGVIAAEAFFRTGQPDEAHRILDAYFERELGNDRAYELLLAMDGDQAMAKLETLAQRDPYQERPYIWEGVILLRQGKAAEAEQVLRRAIAIDPSDGESPHGDRMRAYDVLAQALDAQGRTEDAKVYHNAIQAIRLAEKADDFYNTGLTARGLQMYRDALGIFTDAYCIQSRLAKDLYSEGRYAEAAEHYQRAFELMPVSFGRMESHCFGCEGVFEGPLAESVAEKVFTAAIAAHPQQPQAHYLLGIFYENFDRPEQAAASFAEAVKLDPLYINAWKHLRENASQLPAHSAQVNEAALAVARLIPAGLDYSFDSNGVTDLAELWKIVADKTAGNPARRAAAVLPLPATARRRAAHPAPEGEDYRNTSNPASPERMVLGQSFIQTLWRIY